MPLHEWACYNNKRLRANLPPPLPRTYIRFPEPPAPGGDYAIPSFVAEDMKQNKGVTFASRPPDYSHRRHERGYLESPGPGAHDVMAPRYTQPLPFEDRKRPLDLTGGTPIPVPGIDVHY